MVSDPNGDLVKETISFREILSEFGDCGCGYDWKNKRNCKISPTHSYLLIFYCILVLWIIYEFFSIGELLPGWFTGNFKYFGILVFWISVYWLFGVPNADNLSYIGSQKYL
jgi:hypothetical protein